MTQPYIPPTHTDPEAIAAPPLSSFRKRPAAQIQPGDLLLLGGHIWRVKARLTLKSGKVRFTLWAIRGGAPESESFFPREWLSCVKGW